MQRLCALALLSILACADASNLAHEAVPEIVGVIDLRLSGAGTNERPDFGRVTGVLAEPSGRIFVADQADHEIAVFGSDGTFLFVVGREGEGPGELRSPCCLSLGPDRTLWVRDAGNARYVQFAVGEQSAKAIGTMSMAHSDPWLFVPLTFTEDGLRIDVGHQFDPELGLQLTRVYQDEAGNVVRSEVVVEPTDAELGTIVKGDQFNRSYFPQPFGPRSLVAHGPGGRVAQAQSSIFRVAGHDAHRLEWQIERDEGPGPPLTPDEESQAKDRIQLYVERGGGTPSDYPSIPDRKPVLAGLAFDIHGRLWVSWSSEGRASSGAWIYEDRVLVERRTWPSEVRLESYAWLSDTSAIGVVADSLGVQQVVRLRFEEM